MLQVMTLLIALQGQTVSNHVPSEAALAASIQRIAPKFRRVSFRGEFARWYASRILIEAKRRKLDPIALVAVAWTESNFLPWAKGIPGTRRAAEVGVWQLIPLDSPVIAARKSLRGCKPPKMLPRWLRSRWLRGMKRGTCQDQSIADRRRKIGRFSIPELRDYILGTYVAAYEIRAHINNANKRGIKPRLIPGCKLPRETQLKLYQYGHYNTGSKRPLTYYVKRLCRRYGIVQRQTKAFDAKVRALAIRPRTPAPVPRTRTVATTKGGSR